MTRSSPGNPHPRKPRPRNVVVLTVAGVLMFAAAAWGHLNVVPPFAAIEYDADQAQAIHGSAEAFDKAAPIRLNDVTPNDGSYWLARNVSALTELRGYAHIGGEGLTQQEANANVTAIQIWQWVDTNGNGAADDEDQTPQWQKVIEFSPSAGEGNVVGYAIGYPNPVQPTSTWRGDLLQSRTIPLKTGRSTLLLIRVIDISGNTNLMAEITGLERWDNGAVDGIGSDVVADRYMDSDGNTPGMTDGRIEDDDVVWLYVPRLK